MTFMELPPGFRRQGENLVCRLHKSLYGLKQASQNWFATFSKVIQKARYIQSKVDYSLFNKTVGSSFTLVLLYVDDKSSILRNFYSNIFESMILTP